MADYKDLLDQIESGLTVAEPQAASKYSDVLDRIESNTTGGDTNEALGQIEPKVEAPIAVEPLAIAEKAPPVYSQNDLTKDEFYFPIEDYMADRFGSHIRDMDREDIVEKYLNNMRGFAGGNSVRSVNEIVYLNEVGKDEERLAKAGKAYELFQGMQGIAGETEWGERAEIVLDYARSAVFDPINLLGLGVGKVATGTGFRGGSQMAMIAAKQAYKKELAKGATREAAEGIAQGVLRTQTDLVVTATNSRIAQRQAVEKAATTTLQRMTTSTALKEAAIVGSFEAAVSAGTDYLYQDAMLRTKVQDEYNIYQTGLSAMVGLVAGGLSGSLSNIGTGASGNIAPEALKTSTKGSTSISKLVGQASQQAAPAGTPSPPAGNWLADIAKGKELTDQDSEFFTTMLLGDDTKGLKGLAHILLEDGYVWRKRTPDDKATNWVGDIIKESDPQDAKKFMDDFTKATGIDMVDGQKLTIDAFADTFKKKLSDSARVLGAVGQLSKMLGRNTDSITVEDYANSVLGRGTSSAANNKNVGGVVKDLINRDLPDFQNNIIRLLVSNLSTTALNVTGYAAATGLNSASDVGRAVLLGGWSGIYMAYKPAEAKKLGISALGLLQNQVQKARNTLDANATYDTFLQYSQVRPDAMRSLTSVLPGGVEALEKLGKGFDPDTPLLTLKMNQAVDVVQRLSLVSAQDGYTKSIEFVSQMDKFLRRSGDDDGFGMSWNEFFAQPDHHKKMLSEKFLKIEAMAIDETLKAVFSKSYKGEDFLGKMAGIIEDARNLPGVGLLVPFGRFFNNTLGMAYDMTAVGPLLSKAAGNPTNKKTTELAAKGLVSWSLIGMLAQRESDYIDQGLGWSEEIDEDTGEVLDERYEFPYGAYKAIARVAAHWARGESLPKELVVQMGDQFFGQLTRQLGEAGEGVVSIGLALLSPEEGPGLVKVLQDVMGAIVPQVVSGLTRPLEPINTLIGLTRDEEFYVPDRKQGSVALNNSLRYVDQAVALFSGEELAPQKFNAAEGKPLVQASKLFSTTRASKLTSTERVMNTIGRPTYLINTFSQSPEANNRANQLLFEIVESGASRLYGTKKFKEGNLESRTRDWDKLVKDSKDSVLSYMGRLAVNTNDSSLVKMIEISKTSKLKVKRVMEDLGLDKPLDQLSWEELDQLQTGLRFREDFLEAQQ